MKQKRERQPPHLRFLMRDANLNGTTIFLSILQNFLLEKEMMCPSEHLQQ